VVSDELITRAARALAEAAGPAVPVILFGSRARGTSERDSDVDLLVVKRDVVDRFDETVRLARLAADLRVPPTLLW
jgi:predicted nucleotidyltransferase